MAKKNKFDELAEKIIELIGGKENIQYATHCITRLRFNLKDKGRIKEEEIKGLKGTLGCQWSGDQFQIIIGADVADAYDVICAKIGIAKEDAIDENLDAENLGKKKKFSIGLIFDTIVGCIVPLIPILIGCGCVKIVLLLGVQCGLLSETSSTYSILTFVGDAGFYFLPVFVGATAAKKFGANMALGMLIGAIFIHPSFIQMITDGTSMNIYGIPIYATSYTSTIFPALLSVWIMSYIEKFIAKHSPKALRTIIEPLLTILIMLPIALCVLGPIGSFLGTYLSKMLIWLYDTTGFLGVGILAVIWPYMVMTGMHTAFATYSVNAFAINGYEPILLTANIIANINQSAAALGVAIKTKNQDVRSLGISSAITAVVGGVTEPAMYGITLKYKKPMYAAMIGSFAGAVVAALGKAYCYVLPGAASLVAIPCYITDNIANVLWLIAGIIVGFVVTMGIAFVTYKDDFK